MQDPDLIVPPPISEANQPGWKDVLLDPATPQEVDGVFDLLEALPDIVSGAVEIVGGLFEGLSG